MAWVRIGDTATSHPVFLAGAVVSGATSLTKHVLFAVAVELATKSTAHGTDSIISFATAFDTAGHADVDLLVAQLVEAGYLTPIEVDQRRSWRLINDPKFIHIRHSAEIAIDRARKQEAREGTVRLAVQLRDGSRCRYCGKTVDETDQTGGRLATFDHLDPVKLRSGQPAKTPAELVIACRPCNSSRGAAHRDGRGEEWDAAHPLRPVPDPPHYSTHLRAVLTKAGLLPKGTAPAPAERPATDPAPTALRPGTQPDTAGRGVRPAADPAPARGVRPDTAQPNPARPAPPGGPRRTQSPDQAMGGQQGRDGPGRAGPRTAPARRGRRGRRSK